MVSYEGSQTFLSGLSERMLQRGGRAINHKRLREANFCVRFITSRDEGCTVCELRVRGYAMAERALPVAGRALVWSGSMRMNAPSRA